MGDNTAILIGRRIRENGVYSEIVAHDISPEEVAALQEKFNVKGLILSGGPSSVYDPNAPKLNPRILEVNLPILGLCYGHQLLAQLTKGKVEPATCKEYGIAQVTIDKPVGILEGLREKEKVWMSHGDTVFSLPADFESLAHTDNCPVAAFRHKTKPIYGSNGTQKSSTQNMACAYYATLSSKCASAKPTGKWKTSSEKWLPKSKRKSATAEP